MQPAQTARSIPLRLHSRALAGAALTLLALTAPALAVCPLCTAAVRLDADLAACFVQRVDAVMEKLRTQGGGFILVDLSDCVPELRMRNVLPTSEPAAEPEPLDQVFIADATALQCLSQAIARHAGPMEPSHLFDLAQICTP